MLARTTDLSKLSAASNPTALLSVMRGYKGGTRPLFRELHAILREQAEALSDAGQ